jgi:UDP-glucose 4-epimerase
MRAARAGEDLRMTAGTQVRDFQPVEETAQQLLSWLVEAKVTPGKPELVNLGTGNAMTLKAFAEREWTKLRARGRLKAGEIAMRKNEVQRYVPMVTPLVLGSIDP